MVKYVTKFHKCHLDGGCMLELCVCVYRVSYRILSFGMENSKVQCDVEGMYST